jgi:hypothetical protein
MDGVELESAVLNDKVLGTPDWRGRIIDSVVTTDLFGQPISSRKRSCVETRGCCFRELNYVGTIRN